MKNRSTIRYFGCATLIAIGFIFGNIQASKESHAQAAEVDFSSGHFVIVPGYSNRSSKPFYFVVDSNGKATPVTENGKAIRAPQAQEHNEIKLKHSFDRNPNLSVSHSGQIQN